MGPIEPIGIEPVGPSQHVPRPLRVPRDRQEQEPGDRRRSSRDTSDEPSPSDELEGEADGHIDVTV